VATQRQIESAHINGAKSRGPKTVEGKRRSSANARKHGLASKTIAPDPASFAEINVAAAQYVVEFRPASPGELLLIDQMAVAKIRQRQAWAAETAAWNRALAAHDGCIATAFLSLAESNDLACILRYETGFSRQYHRALKQFLAIRELRLRNEPELRDKILRNEPDRSTLRNTILRNEPEPPASTPCRDTILRNEPEPATSIPPSAHNVLDGIDRPVPRTTNAPTAILRNEPDPADSDPPSCTDSAKRTESTRVPGRRCSHCCFLQTELAPRRPIRQRGRDRMPDSPGQ